MNDSFELLVSNARDMARGLVAQLPLILVGLLVFGVAILLARVLRNLVRRTAHRYDPSLAEMMARAAHL